MIRVGVDLDNVLGDFITKACLFYNTKTGKSLSVSDYTSELYDVVWGISPEETHDIMMEFYTKDNILGISPIEGAKTCLNILHSTGNFEFYVITARNENFRRLTEIWLERHYPGIFSGLELLSYFGPKGHKQEKYQTCQKLGCTVMIEDSWNHLFKCLQNGIETCILFNDNKRYKWLEGMTSISDRLKITSSWWQICNILLSIK